MTQGAKPAQRRVPRQPGRPRSHVYYDGTELLAAALQLAKQTITKAYGRAPADAEIARYRDYPMSPAHFDRTVRTERAARDALAEIRQGYTKLQRGIEKALALGQWDPPEHGVALNGDQILISTKPPQTLRPGGYAAALTFHRYILETTLEGLNRIHNVLESLRRREESRDASPATVRAIDHRGLILLNFDRPGQKGGRRWRPAELAAWCLLARGALPDGLVPRRGLTAADVLTTERLALRQRARRRGPDPVHGSAWERTKPSK